MNQSHVDNSITTIPLLPDQRKLFRVGARRFESVNPDSTWYSRSQARYGHDTEPVAVVVIIVVVVIIIISNIMAR